jgi:hypothetical protein
MHRIAREKTDIFVVYNELHQSINRERIIMIQQDSGCTSMSLRCGGRDWSEA